MGAALIEMAQVSRDFDAGKVQALRQIDLRVEPGEWLTVVGPSGKSTLLNLMCGLDLPSSGEVLFQGLPLSSAAAWTRLRARRIGFVFQSFNLLPTLTALENVQIPMFGVYGRKAREQRARELLARVGLAHRGRHRPGNLSGGERQRVAIARSLANSPALILADEPTGNLDSQSSRQVLELLREIYTQDATTVVLVTHNPLVAQHGSRCVKLMDGQITEETQGEAMAGCFS